MTPEPVDKLTLAQLLFWCLLGVGGIVVIIRVFIQVLVP